MSAIAKAMALTLVAAVSGGVAACGASTSTSDGPTAVAAAGVSRTCGGKPAGASDLWGRGCRSRPRAGAETIRHRAGLCFTDAELRLDAGEALGSIEPGERFRGRRRIVHESFSATIGNVARSLQVAQRYADADTRPAVDRITRLAHSGIHQIRRHPWLVIHGGIAAFRRADALARRAGLRNCLS